MQKNFLVKHRRLIRDQSIVQSPLDTKVGTLLGGIHVSDCYYSRGSKKALDEATLLEFKHRKWANSIIDLSNHPNFYIINGATEGINQWMLTEKRPWQTLKGDYEWPLKVSSANSIIVDIDELKPDRVLYLSNPSSVDGNFLNEETLDKINRTGCPVILDCAYLGATRIRQFQIPYKTEQVIFSFSKGWGLIGQRLGLLYTKNHHPTLGMFKHLECWNYLSVRIMNIILDNFEIDTAYLNNIATQKRICDSLGLLPSDTYFVANSADDYFKEKIRAGRMARLCLTPLWEHYQDQDSLYN